MSDTNNAVLVDAETEVATLTLNRPDRLNTINLATLEALIAALDDVAAKKHVRAVVFKGQWKNLLCRCGSGGNG